MNVLGTVVVLHGLSREDLNGQTCVIGKTYPDGGFLVELQSSGKKFRVKSKHITPLQQHIEAIHKSSVLDETQKLKAIQDLNTMSENFTQKHREGACDGDTPASICPPNDVIVPRESKASVLEKVKENWRVLLTVSKELKDDKEIALAAVSQSWVALEYLSDELKNDFEVVFCCVKQNGLALKYVSAELRNNRAIVRSAVEQNVRALSFASTEILADNPFILELVSKSWVALRYASDAIRDDKLVILPVVSRNWKALEFVSDRLKADFDVVCAACASLSQTRSTHSVTPALKHASPGLRAGGFRERVDELFRTQVSMLLCVCSGEGHFQKWPDRRIQLIIATFAGSPSRRLLLDLHRLVGLVGHSKRNTNDGLSTREMLCAILHV